MADVKFTEKLERLIAGRNKAELARQAGLTADTAISNYLHRKGSIPRADIALKIARALAVDFAWLVDDEADWPPPTGDSSPSLALASDDDLMQEAARRYIHTLPRVVRLLSAIEKRDWETVVKHLVAQRSDAKLPAEIEEAVALAQSFWGLLSVGDFDISRHVLRLGVGTLPPDLGPDDINPANLTRRATAIMKNPHVAAVWDFARVYSMEQSGDPRFQGMVAKWVKRMPACPDILYGQDRDQPAGRPERTRKK